MDPFITYNFLLQSDIALELYNEYAKVMPIIDYHSHIPPSEVNKDKNFDNLTQIWLAGDHYKWRAMRTYGIREHFITGNASDREKFQKWAETVPHTVRNPLYHWTHMELKIYFGITDLLTEENAESIYHHCSQKLQTKSFSSRSLLEQMDVEVACTTDDPADSLEHHKALQNKATNFTVEIYPTFRPDNAYSFKNVSQYNDYIEKLEKASNYTIRTFDDLMAALESRIHHFNKQGGVIDDHGLPYIPSDSPEMFNPDHAFKQIRSGQSLSLAQQDNLTYHILLELGRIYSSYGWVQQFHLGPIRDNNQRMKQKVGSDAGFDSIGDFSQASSLAHFLNDLDKTKELPKTILYNNNPADNAVFSSMIGNFNDGSVKGKIQHGTAWWHMDQKNGIERHLNTLSNLSLMSCFIGMLTDSRSFLSYSRHDYFRRILCNLIAKDIKKGLLPHDINWIGEIISDICYYNAKEYFNFN